MTSEEQFEQFLDDSPIYTGHNWSLNSRVEAQKKSMWVSWQESRKQALDTFKKRMGKKISSGQISGDPKSLEAYKMMSKMICQILGE